MPPINISHEGTVPIADCVRVLLRCPDVLLRGILRICAEGNFDLASLDKSEWSVFGSIDRASKEGCLKELREYLQASSLALWPTVRGTLQTERAYFITAGQEDPDA